MVKVATIINTHGLKGECKLYLHTDDAFSRFKKGKQLYFEDGRSLEVVSYREQKGFGYAKFIGIDTIEKAEALKTKDLFVRKEELPELEDGEYYYYQLMNCKVLNEKKEELGLVTDILETGANLVLRVSSGISNFLLPFVESFLIDVDIENKVIEIHEMEGLR